MAEAPWIKWYSDDFLLGVVDLSADEIGVYTVALSLMASRGGPIPDDRAWLARRAGTSTRRLNQIIEHLCALGKLQLRAGLLGNPRMIRELEGRADKSSKARSAAMARWHGDQDELPLDGSTVPPSARAHGAKIKSGKKAGNAEEQNALKSGYSEQEPQETAESGNANASPPVRAREESRIQNHTQLTSSDSKPEASGPGLLANADLKDRLDAVCDAAGFRPVQPEAISRALTQVEDWTKRGIDFDEIVIPTIRAAVAESNEPTRTLGRFRKAVDHQHARAKALNGSGRAFSPPASPVLEPEGEDPLFRPMRLALLEELGGPAYCMGFNDVRFEDVGDSAGKHPLRVTGASHRVEPLRHGSWKPVLLKAARAHGFDEVW